MASFKSHPFFFTSLLLAGALTAGQAWLLFSQRSATQRVTAEIEEKKQTLAGFANKSPFPSRANLEAIEADRAATEATRDQIRSVLQATGEVADRIAKATPPSSPTDSYFDIANFVERLRSQARTSGVTLAADNRFGFSAYASTGPERGLIVPVFHQRQYAEYLVGALLTSSNPPREFISLQRERPLTPEQKQQLLDAQAQGQSPQTSSDNAGDYFTIDPRTSARVDGFVETMPFRLTFVGNTAVLRAFLNELALFKVSVVVRSVEVEALTGGASTSAPTPPKPASFANSLFSDNTANQVTTEAVKPLVEKVDSRFTVTVEIVSLVDKNAAVEAPNP